MAKYENPAELDYRNGGDTVDDFAQKYMRTVDYIIKALNDLRTPTGNTAGVEPEPYMWRIADNKLYIRNADNTDYVLLGDISPNFGFRQSVNDRFLTTADLEGDGAVVTRNEAGKVEGDITGSPGKIANKTIDVTPSADNDVIAYDATQQKWVKKTLNDYLKKQGDAGWDEMVDEVADQVIEDITPIIFNFWYLDDDGYLVPLVGSTEGGLPSIHGMVGDYEQITARSVEVAGNISATGNVTAGMLTTPQANVTTLTANAVNAGTVNANSASVTEISAGKVTANDVIAKGPVVDVRAFGAKGDGVHDDTSAIQAAIDYAETLGQKCVEIIVPDICKVTSLYTRNDGDDSWRRQLIFCGGGGFYSESDFLFKRKAGFEYLVGNLTFRDIVFKSVAGNGFAVMPGYPFLRCRWINCTFRAIDHIIKADDFVQTMSFLHCTMVFGNGFLIDLSNGCADVNLENCLIESRNNGVIKQNKIVSGYQAVAINVVDCCIEGLSGDAVFDMTQCEMSIRGCYFESDPYIVKMVCDNRNQTLNLEFDHNYCVIMKEGFNALTYLHCTDDSYISSGLDPARTNISLKNNRTLVPLINIDDVNVGYNTASLIRPIIKFSGNVTNTNLPTSYTKGNDKITVTSNFVEFTGDFPFKVVDNALQTYMSTDDMYYGTVSGVRFCFQNSSFVILQYYEVTLTANEEKTITVPLTSKSPLGMVVNCISSEILVLSTIWVQGNAYIRLKNTAAAARTTELRLYCNPRVPSIM